MPFFVEFDPSLKKPPNANSAADSVWQRISKTGFQITYAGRTSVTRIPSDPALSGNAESQPEWVVVEGYFDRHCEMQGANGPSSTASRIAQLLVRKGFSVLEQLQGCFVILLARPERGKVCVYRDRLGGRTAYWHHAGDRFILASSASLIARALGQVHFNQQWLSHWFGIRWPSRLASTPFAGIHELLPGERLEFVDGRVIRERVPFTVPATAPRLSSADWVDRFRSTFADSVSTCLPEQGDAAVMLSGGMDSGPTAVIASGLLNDQDRSLTAVSWSLPAVPDADETKHIRMLADSLQLPLELFDGGDCVPFDRLTTDLVVSDFPTFNFYREMILRCYQVAADRGLHVILNAAKGDLVYPPGNAQLAELVGPGRDGLLFRSWP